MTNLTNSEELRKLIDKKGIKLQSIAESLGISRYALSKKIDNKSQFKSGEIKALCDLLEIDSLSEKERIFFA